MSLRNLYNLVRQWLWEAGGIASALDLGLDGLGSGVYEPCPCKAEAPRRAPENAACRNSSSF